MHENKNILQSCVCQKTIALHHEGLLRVNDYKLFCLPKKGKLFIRERVDVSITSLLKSMRESRFVLKGISFFQVSRIQKNRDAPIPRA